MIVTVMVRAMMVTTMMMMMMMTWRMCSTKSGAITAERSQSSLERRRNSHS